MDLGELGADVGFEVRGRVVLADGRPVPPKTRVRIDRLRAWDGVEVELSPAGELRVGGLPRETVELSIRVPGYELSPDHLNLLPDAGDSRTTLAGRLVRETDLRIVLVPAAERAPAFPQTPEKWAELEARQEAVRARELAGAPPAE